MEDEIMTAPRETHLRYRDPQNEGLVLVYDPESLAGYSSERAQPGDESLPYMPPDEYQSLMGALEGAKPTPAFIAKKGGDGSPRPHDPKRRFLDSVKSKARGNMAQDMRKALAPVPQPTPPLPTPQTADPSTPAPPTSAAPQEPGLEDLEAALGAFPAEEPVQVAGLKPGQGIGGGDPVAPEGGGLEDLDEDELQRLLAEA